MYINTYVKKDQFCSVKLFLTTALLNLLQMEISQKEHIQKGDSKFTKQKE